MTVQKLTALEQGNPANSNGADVASSVNSLIDQAQVSEDLLNDVGVFTEDIISDNVSMIVALQELESYAFENRDRIITTTTRSLATQAIPTHDGTAATEIAVDVGDVITPTHTVGPGGVIVILQDLLSVSVLAELHVNHTGGQASNLVLWVEISTDGGTTWELTPESSLRSEALEKNGNTMVLVDLSVDTPVPAGGRFRLMATNPGAGSLEFTPPTALLTSKGSATGFATKLIVKAKVS